MRKKARTTKDSRRQRTIQVLLRTTAIGTLIVYYAALAKTIVTLSTYRLIVQRQIEILYVLLVCHDVKRARNIG